MGNEIALINNVTESASQDLAYMKSQDTETTKACQTDMTSMDLCHIFSQLQISKSKSEKLLARIDKMELVMESFIGNDEKSKYFTGVHNYKTLILIHETIAPHLYTRSNKALSSFQQLLITLMKLRLNLPYKYLSYRC